MSEQVSTAEILARASQQAEAAEVYEVLREARPVFFRSNTLEAVRSVETAGRALRLIANGRLGYSTTTDLADRTTLVRNALDSARYGDVVDLRFPPRQPQPEVPRFDPAVEALREEEMIAMGKEAVARVRALYPGVQVHVHLRKNIEEVRLLNSAGLDVQDRRTSLAMEVTAQKVGEGEILFVSESAASRRRDEIDPAALAARVVEVLRWTERVVPVRSGTMPVIFHGEAAPVLFLPFLYGFNGRDVYQGTSPLSTRLGQQAFDRRISLVDDGRLPFAVRSAPTDDEGVPTTEKPLIETGVVRQFLYDLRTAALAGTTPTGNGFKAGAMEGSDFRRQPDIAPGSWRVAPGEKSLAQILGDLEEVLLVEGVLGMGQGNLQAGEFSNNVDLAFLVRRGEVLGRVKGTMIAGNAYELLQDHLLAIASDPKWVMGWLHVPSIVLEGVSVTSAA